jgi:hypothetical protein
MPPLAWIADGLFRGGESDSARIAATSAGDRISET